MSGGYFDYQQYQMRDIANTIERDIARALKPKPAMLHEDYWTIYEMNSLHSRHGFAGCHEYHSYEEAKEDLMLMAPVIKATHDYGKEGFLSDGVIFQSTNLYMRDTINGEKIPVLYSIHHCEYDHYPYDQDVLELADETIETMKIAYRQIRIAEVYANRVDWMMSGDDGEDNFQERLIKDLTDIDKELEFKDWDDPYDGWDDNEV